ncbi:MAG: hypothetical protein ACE5G9_02000 [Nitrospinales bacterium]
MKFVKLIFLALFVACSAIPAGAENENELVVGENLKVGMPLTDAFKLLGLPKRIQVRRGTDRLSDGIAIAYVDHGVVIHAVNKGSVVEGIEVSLRFAGRFAAGIKIGDSFKTMIEKYGVPESFKSGVARYPKRHLIFVLNQEKIVSAKVFAKDTPLLAGRIAVSGK